MIAGENENNILMTSVRVSSSIRVFGTIYFTVFLLHAKVQDVQAHRETVCTVVDWIAMIPCHTISDATHLLLWRNFNLFEFSLMNIEQCWSSTATQQWWCDDSMISRFIIYSLRCNSYLDCLWSIRMHFCIENILSPLLRWGLIQQHYVRSLDLMAKSVQFISFNVNAFTFFFSFFPLSHAEMSTKIEQCVDKKKMCDIDNRDQIEKDFNMNSPLSNKRPEWKYE